MPAPKKGCEMTSRFQRNAVVAVAGLVLMMAASIPLRAEDDNARRILFTQQDAVQAFGANGHGFQIGTATGMISGTSFVEFQFAFLAPVPDADGSFPIAFQNKVIITDIDGDQIFFDNDGTGKFFAGIPGSPFIGTGGPLRGTYVVTGATGKYRRWRVGRTFNYRAIATNPPAPGGLGNVYVEVSTRRNAND